MRNGKGVMIMANLIRSQRPRWAEGLTTRNWDPYTALRELMEWDPFGEMQPSPTEGGGFTPRFEVKETKDAYVFKADLPGIEENALDISMTGNRLTVSGQREAERRDEGDTYYAYERSYGNFSRSFTLPEGVETERVDAHLEHGVLTITVPKLAELQPRKVSIKGIGKGLGDKMKGFLGKDKEEKKDKGPVS
jgi:HSP20 family protein